jgi:hypothetical protein
MWNGTSLHWGNYDYELAYTGVTTNMLDHLRLKYSEGILSKK